MAKQEWSNNDDMQIVHVPSIILTVDKEQVTQDMWDLAIEQQNKLIVFNNEATRRADNIQAILTIKEKELQDTVDICSRQEEQLKSTREELSKYLFKISDQSKELQFYRRTISELKTLLMQKTIELARHAGFVEGRRAERKDILKENNPSIKYDDPQPLSFQDVAVHTANHEYWLFSGDYENAKAGKQAESVTYR